MKNPTKLPCSIPGCSKPLVNCRGWCSNHYRKWRLYGDPLTQIRVSPGTGNVNAYGYLRISGRLEHITIAEHALGKPLPPDAVVHHADGNKLNNEPSNLVICPDNDYHQLLHLRMRALDACGNANWRKCAYCKTYDDPSDMYVRYGGAYHRQCFNVYQNAKRHGKGIAA